MAFHSFKLSLQSSNFPYNLARSFVPNFVPSLLLSHLSSCPSRISTWEIGGFSPDFTSVLKLNHDKPLPKIRSPNEVLVQVKSASVNPLDVLMCMGYGNEILEKVELITQIKAPQVSYDRFPLTLGRDFSGIVVDKGGAVSQFNVGDEVFGCIPPYKPGTHGQYAVTSASEIIWKPQNLDHNQSACLPYAGLTAFAALSTFAGLNEYNTPGKRILVLGGSGGVGSIAIQLLQNWNARVATTCSSDAIAWLQEQIDIDLIIDYKSNTLSDYEDTFDLVVDCAKRHNGSTIDLTAYKCLKKGACSKYITINSPMLRNFDDKGLFKGLLSNIALASQDTICGIRDQKMIKWAFYHPSQSGLKLLKKLAEEEKIKPIVDQVFTMENLSQAYKKVQDGHLRGKTVIQIQ